MATSSRFTLKIKAQITRKLKIIRWICKKFEISFSLDIHIHLWMLHFAFLCRNSTCILQRCFTPLLLFHRLWLRFVFLCVAQLAWLAIQIWFGQLTSNGNSNVVHKVFHNWECNVFNKLVVPILANSRVVKKYIMQSMPCYKLLVENSINTLKVN